MVNYRDLYIKLFASVADAAEAIEKSNYGMAQDILIRVQQECEEIILQEEADLSLSQP